MLKDLFQKNQKKAAEKGKLYAPVDGDYIPLEKIPDETFASGMMGKGCGIIPVSGKVVSPVDGKIIMVADTKHAVGICGEDGEEILIHIGIDTVMMKGEAFDVKVTVGEKVKMGQTIMLFDLNKVREKAESEITAFLIMNPDEFETIHIDIFNKYKTGQEIGQIH